jgi:hypothetical protein
VKKPRESLTTIGVFLICCATSNALASVASLVFSPTMISSSGILSTGEKKCRPMKSSCRFTPSARPVIGSVDVLEPSTASGATMFSISANTLCFSSVLSKTASMTRSQPARSSALAVAVILARVSSAFSRVDLPRDTAFSKSLTE